MERLKLEKVYVNIRKEDKPNFFFIFFWCINMAAVLLFWHTNLAAVIMRKRFRKWIMIIIIVVIIIILLEFWRESLAFLIIIIRTTIKQKKTELTVKSYLQLISLKMIRWFCTAHNKMATVKEIIWKNIIKMKLTEEKSCWDFPLRLFLAKIRLNVLIIDITRYACWWVRLPHGEPRWWMLN